MGHAFVMEEDGQTGSTAACETFASPVRHHPCLARAVLSSELRLTLFCSVLVRLCWRRRTAAHAAQTRSSPSARPFPAPLRFLNLHPLAESVRLLGAEIATSEVIILTDVAISF